MLWSISCQKGVKWIVIMSKLDQSTDNFIAVSFRSPTSTDQKEVDVIDVGRNLYTIAGQIALDIKYNGEFPNLTYFIYVNSQSSLPNIDTIKQKIQRSHPNAVIQESPSIARIR